MAEYDGDLIIGAGVEEMTQLASRLLVKNKDLYARYDKYMAEASLRMNVSVPLSILLILATWLSGLPIWLQAVLTALASGFGILLWRQGILRAVSARDVIVQALIIDELQSRHIPSEKPITDQDDEPVPSAVTARTGDSPPTADKVKTSQTAPSSSASR